MDLSKHNKPIHFKCPKCGYDLHFNGSALIRKKADLINEKHIIMAKMATYKANGGIKDEYYKKLIKKNADIDTQIASIKNQISFAADEGERQMFIAFKKACKRKWGDEVINQMLIDLEDDFSYSDYDMAIQNHTNFDNV